MDSFPKLSFRCLISVFEFGSHNILLNRWASPQGQEMLCGMRCVSPRETWISRCYHNRSREQHKLDCKDKHLQHFYNWQNLHTLIFASLNTIILASFSISIFTYLCTYINKSLHIPFGRNFVYPNNFFTGQIHPANIHQPNFEWVINNCCQD